MTQGADTRRRYTVEEYFRIDRDSPQKLEFRDGQILDMAGGSPQHSLIIANVIRSVGNRLQGSPCRVYDSNLRVRTGPSVRYAYPDVTVICGEAKFDALDPDRRTVINPRVIIQVLSPTTEAYDRGEKLRRYLEIESLEEYVLASQNEARIETLYRQPQGAWLYTPTSGPEATAVLRSLEVKIPLLEIYSGVEFPPPAELPMIL